MFCSTKSAQRPMITQDSFCASFQMTFDSFRNSCEFKSPSTGPNEKAEPIRLLVRQPFFCSHSQLTSFRYGSSLASAAI